MTQLKIMLPWLALVCVLALLIMTGGGTT